MFETLEEYHKLIARVLLQYLDHRRSSLDSQIAVLRTVFCEFTHLLQHDHIEYNNRWFVKSEMIKDSYPEFIRFFFNEEIFNFSWETTSIVVPEKGDAARKVWCRTILKNVAILFDREDVVDAFERAEQRTPRNILSSTEEKWDKAYVIACLVAMTKGLHSGDMELYSRARDFREHEDMATIRICHHFPHIWEYHSRMRGAHTFASELRCIKEMLFTALKVEKAFPDYILFDTETVPKTFIFGDIRQGYHLNELDTELRREVIKREVIPSNRYGCGKSIYFDTTQNKLIFGKTIKCLQPYDAKVTLFKIFFESGCMGCKNPKGNRLCVSCIYTLHLLRKGRKVEDISPDRGICTVCRKWFSNDDSKSPKWDTCQDCLSQMLGGWYSVEEKFYALIEKDSFFIYLQKILPWIKRKGVNFHSDDFLTSSQSKRDRDNR